MLAYIRIFLIVLICGLCRFETASAIDLGSGISCQGTTIFVNGKASNEKLAKKFLQSKIKKKKAQLKKLKSAVKKKKDKISVASAELKQLKALLKKLKDCENGAYLNTTAQALFESLNGSFAGKYSANLSDIEISGNLILTFNYTVDKVEITLSIEGPLIAFVSAEELSITIDLAGKNLPVSQDFPGTALGDVTLKLGADGAFTITTQSVPNPDAVSGLLTFEGKFIGGFSIFDGTFSITSATAPGVILVAGSTNLTRQ